MKKFAIVFRALVLCVSLVCINSITAQAWGPHPWGDPAQNDEEPEEEPDPEEIPVDGGLSLLVAAGVGYGIKKANDLRKKKTTNGKAEIIN